ncbi:hypothetical protein ACQKK5_17650, partial [Brevibacillus panacihumi]|uniref:hypothetical protein n=1 Tax=Brevibacillus panacihumi TaxID=497735 RepID=UPI003D02F425
ATWLLPRLDFHQLAINGLLGALAAKCVFRLFRSGLVKIPNAFAYFTFFLGQLTYSTDVFSRFSGRGRPPRNPEWSSLLNYFTHF